MVEAGRRLIKKKKTMDHGEWLPWLRANADVLGFQTRQTAHKLMAAARKCRVNATFDEKKALEVSRQVWGNMPRGALGTGENEWFTPQDYLVLVRRVLGAIDLDPATQGR